jgi:uncharacterized radical SAM superfamily Fe-S cluster-containing enzyme
MTIIAGINDQQLGDLLDFALANLDVVCGLSLQPAFTSGRFESRRQRSLSMGDVIFLVAGQSDGRLVPQDFWPLSCSHPLCSCATHLLVDGDAVQPITREITPAEYLARIDPHSPQGSIFADIIAGLEAQGRSLPNGSNRGLSVMISNYMDAGNMDLKRLRECSMTVTMADGRAIPFCAYHLTDVKGQRLYPPWGLKATNVPDKQSGGISVLL